MADPGSTLDSLISNGAPSGYVFTSTGPYKTPSWQAAGAGSGVVQTITATDGTILVGGTAANPTLTATSQKTTNSQSGSAYTLVLSDAGKRVEMTNASACTITVPPNASVAFPIGTMIDVVQYGTGSVTMSPGAGVTLDAEGARLRLPAQFTSATLWKRATNEWVVTFVVQSSRQIDVRDYGAVGDGVNDDTTAIQNAVNASVISVAQTIQVYFPRGTYKITSSITIPTTPGITLVGDGMYETIVEQQTAGQKVWNILQAGTGVNSPITHSFTVMDMACGFNVAQTNSGSVAFFYDWTSPSTQGSFFFNHMFRNIRVYNTYDAWGYNPAHGTMSVWASTWDHIVVSSTKHSVINFLAAGTVGTPNLRFYNFYASNTGSGIQSTGPMFLLEAVGECTMVGMDLEGWYDTILSMDSGNTKITGLHLENNVMNAAFSKMFIVSNGTLSIDTWTASGIATTAGNTDQVSMVQLDASGRLDLRNGYHNVDCTLGTSYIRELVYSTAGNNPNVSVWNVRRTGGGLSGIGQHDGTGASDRSAETGEFIFGGRRQLTWAAAGTITAVDLVNVDSRRFWINIPSNTSSTFPNPTSPRADDVITIEYINGSGGVLTGTLSWGAAFKFAAGTAPTIASVATTKRRLIEFQYDAVNALWIERFRSTGDI